MGYLHTERLSVGYGRKVVLGEIMLSVERGEIVTLIGPNGAGKSTILKSIIRQLPPLGGSVTLEGKDISVFTESALAERMSILMTERVHAELMTGYDVAAAGRYPYTGRLGILSVKDRRAVEEALELVGAAELGAVRYDRMSDGQRQRILLARAICQEPELIVMDEPTSFLDIRFKPEFMNLLRRLVREKGIAVLLSLHELDFAQKISDRVVCVGENGIFAMGSPEEIFSPEIICPLYGISERSYLSAFGTVELAACDDAPDTFVICGNGTGISLFRYLQREGTPFAAGILWENDIDYPVAAALAAEVIHVPAFEPVPEAEYLRARRCLEGCGRVLCTLPEFGTYNAVNKELLDLARRLGSDADVKNL